MRLILTLSLIITLLLVTHSTYALKFKRISLEDLYNDSVVVAHVIIKSGNISTYSTDNKNDTCGVNYLADIVESYKGKTTSFKFRASNTLNVGQEYILFLSEKDLATSVRFMSMGEHREGLYNKCMEIGPGLYTSWWQGGTFELKQVLEPKSNEFVVWLKHSSDHLVVNQSIIQKNISMSLPKELENSDLWIDTNYQLYKKNEFIKFITESHTPKYN